MKKVEQMSIALDMRIEGYGYEAIAEFLEVSTFFAKRLVTEAFNKEQRGTWKRSGG